MNHLIRYCKGYVRLMLRGNMPERFLNLCAANGIFLWDLLHAEGGYLLSMSVKDFRRVQPLCRKAGARLHICEKHGLPFSFYRSRKRKGFFAGLFLFLGLLYLLSCFIWNIHIEGNYANSTYTLLRFLEQQGVRHGIAKSSLSCQQIADSIREAFPNVTWVSARIQGTRLLIDIKENVDGYRPEEKSEEACSLAAARDGTVVSIVTRAGTPVVAEGSVCAAGDILVSGEIPIVNDAGETVRYEYVHADADIYLETTYYYYNEFPLRHTVRTYEEKESRIPFLELGSLRFALGTLGLSSKNAVSWEEQHQVFLTESFALPIYYGSVYGRAYTETEELYTEEEARREAERRLSEYTEGLEKQGIQVSERRVEIKLTDTACVAKGELTVVEQAAVETPCERREASPEQQAGEEPAS